MCCMRSTDYILKLENVSKSFSKNFEVIRNVNIKIKKGEFVCFIGPSGCGKTVLLYIIAGFLPISSGKMLMEGRVVNSIRPDRIMVFQDNMLFPWKTTLGNVLFGLSNSNLGERERISLAEYYLNMVGLLEFKNWPIHKLSGGMKQRVSFARSLVTDPKILLMDEPFSALDSLTRRRLRKNLIEIWQKTQKTTLFVTHSMDEAIYLADTIYVMSSRPMSIKKSYSVDFPRPRDMSDPNFIKLLKVLEKDLEKDFSDKNQDNRQVDIDSVIINKL